MDAPKKPDRTPVNINHIREAAGSRVIATSLRKVAREIGMSPTGLRKFLDGTEPYSPTVHRLRAWYVRYTALAGAEISREDAAAALAVLTRDLAETPRREAAAAMLEALGRGYEASGRGRPPWVAELRADERES